ncbi:unnamed protein product [Darwinula stevensoni]|uniref:Anoctamin dimerisation domain-containing protein n=1 Tax=Darwinula stevensoni TaxID=69355 RepID=A0A7R8XCD8_9CRUS|nr:unnamed protein product [Darwinula stevensoni]CAG0888718.1 unnamed protein product [Darwinula stevensoni]
MQVKQDKQNRFSFLNVLISAFQFGQSILTRKHHSNHSDRCMRQIRDEEFSQAQRIYIVYEILRTPGSEDGEEETGIRELTDDKVYRGFLFPTDGILFWQSYCALCLR